MPVQYTQCKQFDGLCDCGSTCIRFGDIGMLSEHFFALVLQAVANRCIGKESGQVHMQVDARARYNLAYEIRCNGTVYVGEDFGRDIVNYNYVCMPTVVTGINIWRRANPESKYIAVVDRFLHAAMGDRGMHDARAFLDMYVQATR